MKRFNLFLPVAISIFMGFIEVSFAATATITSASGDPAVEGSLYYELSQQIVSGTDFYYDIPGAGPFTTTLTNSARFEEGGAITIEPLILDQGFYQDVSLLGEDIVWELTDGNSVALRGYNTVALDISLRDQNSTFIGGGPSQISHIPTSRFTGTITGTGTFIAEAHAIFSNDVNITGTFVKNNDGIATFTKDVAVDGTTEINQGNLVLSGRVKNLASDIVFKTSGLENPTTLTLGSTKNQVLSGDISADDNVLATIIKQNSGRTTLSGALNFPGIITILDDGGTLAFTGDFSDLTANIYVGKNSILELASSSVLSSGIFGDGGVTIAGNVELSGTTGYFGPTQIQSGNLTLSNSGLFGDVTVGEGATFTIGGDEDIRQEFLGALSGSGNLVKTQNNTAVFSGDFSLTGDINLSEGNLGLFGSASNEMTNTITLGENTVLGLGSTSGQIFNGVISGEGRLEALNVLTIMC